MVIVAGDGGGGGRGDGEKMEEVKCRLYQLSDLMHVIASAHMP